MSYISIITPGIALLLGWLVRDERLTLSSLAGGLLILLGLALAVSRGGGRSAAMPLPGSSDEHP